MNNVLQLFLPYLFTEVDWDTCGKKQTNIYTIAYKIHKNNIIVESPLVSQEIPNF